MAKELNINLLADAMANVLSRRYGVEIKATVRKKTPEELAKEKTEKSA